MTRPVTNPTRIDPSRTALIRRLWTAAIRRRFRALGRLIYRLVAREDAFGLARLAGLDVLIRGSGVVNWRYGSAEEKVAAFTGWLASQTEVFLRESIVDNVHLDRAFRKGIERAWTDARGLDLDGMGGMSSFYQAVVNRPATQERYRLLVSRAQADMQGLVDSLTTMLRRSVYDGLLAGVLPVQMGAALARDVGVISFRGAQAVSSSTISAHAEGQLVGYEELGESQVGVRAEWVVSPDSRACPRCKQLEGKLLTLEQARGKIPVHLGCRCSYTLARRVR